MNFYHRLVFCLAFIFALPLSTVAHASAPQLKSQAPGYYRMILGDFEVTALSDGTFEIPVDKLLGNTTPAKVENSKGWMTGEPLIWDNLSGNFSGLNTETHFKVPAQPASGTNPPAAIVPLNFLK